MRKGHSENNGNYLEQCFATDVPTLAGTQKNVINEFVLKL